MVESRKSAREGCGSCLRSDVLLTDYNLFAFGDPFRLVRRKEESCDE